MSGNHSYSRIVAHLDALSKRRALTEQESIYLEWALKGQAGEALRGTNARDRMLTA